MCLLRVDDAEQATRVGVVPAGSVQIEDVWHVSGLKGTSSNDIVVSDLFIPEEWTGNFAELPKIVPNAHVVSSAGCASRPDRVHFAAAGYRELGKRYGEKMLALLGVKVAEPK